MLTEFGKELRKLRLDKGEILKNMANRLSISSAYLSAIECGKRDIPYNFISRIQEEYCLNKEQVDKLEIAKNASIKKIDMHLENANDSQRQLVIRLARTFKDLNEIQINNLNNILAENDTTKEVK